ncbi:MAG: 16S rRNA (cytosine(1402)-N(4))-methyltransferase RsmH [Magnetococcales bacterium]|nr:16S rRNA (cytosine(1402)-N(4))-methyltransferase RsmH [Magnetococcales bacterium]
MRGRFLLTDADDSTLHNASSDTGHCSVLPRETLEALLPRPGGIYVDATFGDGGHTEALLAASAPDGRVIALDRDAAAVERGTPRVQAAAGRLQLLHARFSQLAAIVEPLGLKERVDGILFDVGLSSRQLDARTRGFSFRLDGPLDMRMDQTTPAPTAAELLNRLPAEALADLFFQYGEERHARKAARAIVEQRRTQPFATTRQLARLLERILPAGGPIHPATRIFQALRIAVNQELEELTQGVQTALELVAPGGRVAVISFHSLEDRIVKHTFRAATAPPPPPTGPAAWLPVTTPPQVLKFRLPFSRPVTPDTLEIRANPRARSAKLRVIERLPAPSLDRIP